MEPQSLARPPRVLLVEDNAADVILTREAFRSARFEVALEHVVDGVDCMQYLRQEGDYKDREIPDLVLLDLNLPRKDGREVLTDIVADEKLRHIPVVVLTTSSAKADRQAMYGLRCSSYVRKPVGFEQFSETLKELGEYWFDLVELPTRP